MSNPSAFPIQFCNEPGAYEADPGMSLRDWFAGQALAGICANSAWIDTFATIGIDQTASAAYRLADIMLAKRSEPEAS